MPSLQSTGVEPPQSTTSSNGHLYQQQPLDSDILPLTRQPNLFLKSNTPKGRGVFAGSPIQRGQIVDVSPVLVFGDETEKRRVGGTVLAGYTYNWPIPTSKPTTSLNNDDDDDDNPSSSATNTTSSSNSSSHSPTRRPIQPPQALPLGLGSLFNHSSHPYHQNVVWTRDLANECLIYTAARDIEAGEELCISYGDSARLWFKDADARETTPETEDVLLENIEL